MAEEFKIVSTPNEFEVVASPDDEFQVVSAPPQAVPEVFGPASTLPLAPSEEQQILAPLKFATRPIAPDRGAALAAKGIGGTARLVEQAAFPIQQQFAGTKFTGEQPQPLFEAAVEAVPQLKPFLRPDIEAKNAREKILELISDPTIISSVGPLAKAASSATKALVTRGVERLFARRLALTIPEQQTIAESLEKIYGPEKILAKKIAIDDANQLLEWAKQLQKLTDENTGLKVAYNAQIANANASVPDLETPFQIRTLQRQISQNAWERAKLARQIQNKLDGPGVEAYHKALEYVENPGLIADTVSRQGIVLTPEQVEQARALKPLSNLPGVAGQLQSAFRASAFSFDDIVRLGHQVDGAPRGFFSRSVVEPIAEALAVADAETIVLKQRVRDKAQQLGIDVNSKVEREFLFRLADKDPAAWTSEEVKQLTPRQHEFINFTKKIYNDLINEINAKRIEFGLEPIAVRKNYVTHLQELSSLDALGMDPITANVSPKVGKGIAFQFGKKRLGTRAKQDILEALDAYIGPARRQVNLIQPVAQAEALLPHMPSDIQEATSLWLNTAIKRGAPDPKDLAVKALGRIGELTLDTATTLQAAINRSILGGSFRVLIQQPSQLTHTALQTGLGKTLGGLAKGWSDEAIPEAIRKTSTFLSNRSLRDEIIPVNTGLLKSADKFVGTMLDFGDRAMARASWIAAFDQAKSYGVADQVARRYADHYAQMLHAIYRDEFKPAILRGRLAKVVLPMQTFGFNLWNFISKDPTMLAQLNNTSKLREFMKIVGAMYAMNLAYNIAGVGGVGPFQLALPKEASYAGFREAAEITALTFPLTGAARFGLEPGPVKLFKAITDMQTLQKAFLHAEPEKRAEAKKEFFKQQVLTFVPFGRQAKDTWEGVEAIRDGYYKIGREEINIKGLDKARALFIGPKALSKAKEEKSRQRVESLNKILGRD